MKLNDLAFTSERVCAKKLVLNEGNSRLEKATFRLMYLSMVCPRMGGGGGNPPSRKVGISGPPSWRMPRSHLDELPAFFAWPFFSFNSDVRSILLFLKQKIVVFNTHQLSIFEVL